jgi:hypothetical protein
MGLIGETGRRDVVRRSILEKASLRNMRERAAGPEVFHEEGGGMMRGAGIWGRWWGSKAVHARRKRPESAQKAAPLPTVVHQPQRVARSTVRHTDGTTAVVRNSECFYFR